MVPEEGIEPCATMVLTINPIYVAITEMHGSGRDVMTPSTFDIKIIQKQATPGPVTTATGTGNSATRAEFFMSLSVPAGPAPQSVPATGPHVSVK